MKYIENLLIKLRNNQIQSALGKEEREKNVKDLYKINKIYKNIIKDKKILLVDDIFTTGNTVNECSKVLLNSGACKIGILTIAKD